MSCCLGKRKAGDDAADQVLTAPSISKNDDSKPYALDQQQLDFIGYDRDKLQDFKNRLEEAIEKIAAASEHEGDRDTNNYDKQRVEYSNLKAKVDVRIAAINTFRPATTLNQNNDRNDPFSNDDYLPLVEVLPKRMARIPDNGSDSEDDEGDGDGDEEDDQRQLNEDPIQRQKDRAVQLLGSLQAVPDEHGRWMANIQAALVHQGRVKPIFHSLFLPDTFLNNPRSFSQVTAGEVDEQQTLEFDQSGKNLDEAVDNISGAGAHAIIDEGLGLGSKWKFNSDQTAFAVELVNTDAEMLGEDVECTKFTSIPTEVDSGDTSYTLLTRPESRGVVSDIFHKFAKEVGRGSVGAITGSPGIGKSWTLFYALQQALLYDGATVLFFFQKKDFAVLYLRRNNKVYAWKSKTKASADSCLFRRLDVLVLLDPEEAKKGGADFKMGRTKLCYAASNNEGHFRNSAAKTNGGMQAFLGPPLDRELQVMLRRIDPTLTPDVVEERKKNVGNLPRYILDAVIYNERIMATTKAVDECAGDTRKLKEALRNEGMSVGHLNISGTLFQVLPTRPEKPASTGYDGQHVKYRERVVQAVNDNVRNAILTAGRETILTYWGKVSGDEYARMGKKAEELFIKDLTNPKGFVMKRYLQGVKEESTLVVKSRAGVKRNVTISEVCGKVLKKQNIVAELASNCKLIDAAGPGRKVYQVTVSGSHSLSLNAVEHICREMGYIGKGGNIIPEDETLTLEYYWVVPIALASKWKEKAPYKYKGPGNQTRKVLVNEFLKIHVKQYVLPMTYEPPISFSNWKKGDNPR